MENETLETFLEDLELKSSLDLFRDQKLNLDILKTLTEEELRGVLKELKLPIVDRMRILEKIKEIRGTGKCTIFSSKCIFSKERKVKDFIDFSHELFFQCQVFS